MQAARNENPEERAREEASARQLAERWALEYRSHHALSVDPRVVENVEVEEARRLRAVPLSVGQEGLVFAIAEPEEERFRAVRALAGAPASFVVVTPTALDALLSSRLFHARATRRAAPAVAVTDPEPSGSSTAATPAPRADTPAALAVAVIDPDPSSGSAAGTASPPPDAPAALVEELLARLGSSSVALQSHVDQLETDLAASRRELWETRAQLATARQTHERQQEAISSLEGELARSRSVNVSTTTHLRDLVRSFREPAKVGLPGG